MTGELRFGPVHELLEGGLAFHRGPAVGNEGSVVSGAFESSGPARLSPGPALIAELVRRYSVLGFECSLLEIQKLAWFLERAIRQLGLPDPLDLRFAADRYGPYAHRLTKLLDNLDGSFLRCDKRLADASPLDAIWFEDRQRERVSAFLRGSEAAPYQSALESVSRLIDGFQSPYGMELLATVDWLVNREGIAPETDEVRAALARWPAGQPHAERKVRLFDEHSVALALRALLPFNGQAAAQGLVDGARRVAGR